MGIEAPFQEGFRLLAKAYGKEWTWQQAYEKGFKEGYEEGLKMGRQERFRMSIVEILRNRFGTVPEELTAALESVTVEQQLRALIESAVTCADLAAFAAALRPAQS
ncbi:hypothetical protein [Gemmata sp.]|uniref:hypothetical protein n=1 Tax=Gemmata sp. TaxID=1914242 RepID=UPI003F6FD552